MARRGGRRGCDQEADRAGRELDLEAGKSKEL